MKLCNILNELGIERIPELIEEIYNSPDFDPKSTAFLDPDYMRKISRKYDYFGEYEEKAVANAQKIKDDEALLAMLNLCVEYLRRVDGDFDKVVEFPKPKRAMDADALGMFVAVLYLTQIEASEERYLKRGLDPDFAMNTVKAFGSCFKRGTAVTGTVGIAPLYVSWLCIYISALIVNIYGFNFEVRRYTHETLYLKNKTSGDVRVLVYNQMIHHSGKILGSECCADEEGSFFADLEETETEYIGFVADENALVQNKKERFAKSEWDVILKPGDDTISFHIPKGADMSDENLDRVFTKGAEFVKKLYPEMNIRCITCFSWLLSPELKEILKPESKILAFGDRYVRFPFKDTGKSVFSFVFIGKYDSYNDLPENTSLERALKKRYLDGECIHSYGGAFEIK